MEALEQHDPRVERANTLYWKSGRSVNQIADEMELSKGMLYEMIHPLRYGLPCPRCSSDMEYANRTARERTLLTCASCRFEAEEEDVRNRWSDAAEAAPGGQLVVTPDPAPPQKLRRIPPDRLPRDPLVIGAGLLLIATGIWLFRGLRKR